MKDINLKSCCKGREIHEERDGVTLGYDSFFGIHWEDSNASDADYYYTISFCPWCGVNLVDLLDCDPDLIPTLDLTDWKE